MNQYKHTKTGIVISTVCTVNAPEWVLLNPEPLTDKPKKGVKAGARVRKQK